MTSTIDWLHEDDGSTELLCDQAQRLLSLGDIEQATRVYQLASLLHPLDPAPWIGLGLCQKERGEAAAAELSLTVAHALGADHPGVLAHRAECHLRQGKSEEAAEDLKKAVARASALGDVYTESRALRTIELIDHAQKSEVGS